ncbi:hypothetical protein SAMN05444678_106230 [Sphingomonas sp. YR710]|uniref:hypothetical protein n=1 Tax=Sphingomonas sp. YR710 TaxID=1882773 RepID=UPI00088A6106|nr:hypothetical protein [Sphingomonas sp. YR710]SDC89067.1 hypothetical protein SAMN05444678_106230 [Sphingomonas sp. YR710]
MRFRSVRKAVGRAIPSRPIFILSVIFWTLLPLAPSPALVLGADQRNMRSALVANGRDARFDGLGRVECLEPNTRGISHNSTGWIMAAPDTVITAAHAFYMTSSATEGGSPKILDPHGCIFVVFNSDQSIRQIVNIRYGVSPWSARKNRGDSSYDIAIIKLDRPVKVTSIPSARAPQSCPRASVDLLSFQTGVAKAELARRTSGVILPFPREQLRRDSDGTRISNASRLFSTSASSSAGSSGGMYYLDQWQAAIGVHVGFVCDAAKPQRDFDPVSCFNYGLYFNDAILAMVDAVAHDKPDSRQIIRQDQQEAGATR